jgi:hypothetical protein
LALVVPVDPALDDPVLDDPVLAVPAPPVLAVLVEPAFGLLVDAELDAEELGVVGLALAEPGPDAVMAGWAVLVGAGVVLAQLVAAAVVVLASFLLLVALRLAVAVAVEVELAVVVAVLVAVAEAVAVLVAVLVAVAWVLLDVPPAGLVAGFSGVAFGVADLLDLALAEDDGEELVGHAVRFALACPPLLVRWLTAPFDEPARVPVPATLWVALALCDGVIPATSPIWTRASRVGGNARATPMANTAHATARAGRSSPSRQSLGSRRA